MKKNALLMLFAMIFSFGILECKANYSKNNAKTSFTNDPQSSDIDGNVQKIKNRIEKMQQIVNDKSGKEETKEREIESMMKEIMDYNSFFEKVMPKNKSGKSIWTEFNEQEKTKIIDIYNREYVVTYFQVLTQCSPLKITFLNKIEEGKSYDTLKGTYTCSASGESKTFNILKAKSSTKVMNIVLGPISFLFNQKKDLEEKTAADIRNKINLTTNKRQR